VNSRRKTVLKLVAKCGRVTIARPLDQKLRIPSQPRMTAPSWGSERKGQKGGVNKRRNKVKLGPYGVTGEE
jgi:hypothetical protein